MKFIPQATKELIVKKVLNQPNANLKDIARQNNVGYSSLTKWVKQYQSGQIKSSYTQKTTKKSFTRAEQLQHILATATLDEEEVGVYCRERGLYALQLDEWKNQMTKEDDEQKYQELLAELKALRIENKQLKQDINRKDRALAETTALLILKKKADAIWGDQEED